MFHFLGDSVDLLGDGDDLLGDGGDLLGVGLDLLGDGVDLLGYDVDLHGEIVIIFVPFSLFPSHKGNTKFLKRGPNFEQSFQNC